MEPTNAIKLKKLWIISILAIGEFIVSKPNSQLITYVLNVKIKSSLLLKDINCNFHNIFLALKNGKI